MLDLNNNQFLTEEEIKEQAPSIYTMKASKDTSKHYVHIPTTQVINDMEALGWGVVDVKQVRSRDRQRSLYTKHLVVFGNNDLKIEGKDGDTVFPRILLTTMVKLPLLSRQVCSVWCVRMDWLLATKTSVK